MTDIELYGAKTGNSFRAALGVLLPERASPAGYRAIERYFYFVTDVIAPSHAAFELAAVSSSEESRKALNERSHHALAIAETFLDQSDYMAGDRFTLADISAYTIALASPPAPDGSAFPKL